MAQVPPALAQAIRENPGAPRQVIVRVSGDLDARAEELAGLGLQIRRSLRLVNGFAGSATGADIQRLAAVSWVTSIEPDQQVHTM